MEYLNRNSSIDIAKLDQMGYLELNHTRSHSIDKITPVFVGVSGGSGSGKTTICKKVISAIGIKDCLILPLDSFYKPVDLNIVHDYNFDHPDALDFDLVYIVLKSLLQRKETEIPKYDFVTNSRLLETQKLKPCDLILFEGIYALYDERIRSLMDLKIFIHCDEDVRLYRRLLRDRIERGREPLNILYQYNRYVKNAFDDFIKPTMKHADLIIPGGASNEIATNFIVNNLKSQLYQLGTFSNTMIASNKEINDFYEIFDANWLNLSDPKQSANENKDMNSHLKFYKTDQIIFNDSEKNKNELCNIFKLLSIDFSIDLYNMIIKRYIKSGLRLFKHHLQGITRKFDPEDILFIHYDMDIDDNIDVFIQDNDNIKQKKICAILGIYCFEYAQQLICKKIQRLKLINPDMRFFVIAAFSNIKNLTEIIAKYQDIKIINTICAINFEGLYNILKNNSLYKHIDLTNEKFYHQKFIKLANNYIQSLNA